MDTGHINMQYENLKTIIYNIQEKINLATSMRLHLFNILQNLNAN